jgi:hypothetical protein
VFRLIREQVAVLNSLKDNLKSRRESRTKRDHPEVLNAVSTTVSNGKSMLQNALRKVKMCKSLMKSVSKSATNAKSKEPLNLDLVLQSNKVLLEAMAIDVDAVNLIVSELNEHKSGLYSRKQQLAKVVADAPDRLVQSLSKLGSIVAKVSEIGSAIDRISGERV